MSRRWRYILITAAFTAIAAILLTVDAHLLNRQPPPEKPPVEEVEN